MSDTGIPDDLLELKVEFHKLDGELPTLTDRETWLAAHNRMGELAVLINKHKAFQGLSAQDRLDLDMRASKAGRELAAAGRDQDSAGG